MREEGWKELFAVFFQVHKLLHEITPHRREFANRSELCTIMEKL